MLELRHLYVTLICFVDLYVHPDILVTFFSSRDQYSGCLQLAAATHNVVINILESLFTYLCENLFEFINRKSLSQALSTFYLPQ